MSSLGQVVSRGSIVHGNTKFFLKHVDTERFLISDNDSAYNNQNCPRCPIVGHNEISAARAKQGISLWKVHSGFFFPMKEIVEDDEPSRYQSAVFTDEL